MIDLHVLGAGGAAPTATHGPAAYWARVDSCGLLIDPGPGALVRLVRAPGAPATVDAIDTVLISHLHLDHVADLAPLLFAQHLVTAEEEGPLLVAGPPGLQRYVERLHALYGDWLEPRRRTLEIREVTPGERVELAGGAMATALPAHHPVAQFDSPGQGWLLRDRTGHRLAYTGDSGPCDAFATAAAGCDLLLVECSTPDDLAVATHHSPSSVIDLVRNVQPDLVVLTHMYPLVVSRKPADIVSAATGVRCIAARDGDRFAIP